MIYKREQFFSELNSKLLSLLSLLQTEFRAFSAAFSIKYPFSQLYWNDYVQQTLLVVTTIDDKDNNYTSERRAKL